jgi:hypothetical protein
LLSPLHTSGSNSLLWIHISLYQFYTYELSLEQEDHRDSDQWVRSRWIKEPAKKSISNISISRMNEGFHQFSLFHQLPPCLPFPMPQWQ